MKQLTICVDFDGTCVTHEFPKVGKDIGAAPVLQRLVANGHRLILWTMRSDSEKVESDSEEICSVAGNYLTDAVNWFKDNDIPLFGINENLEQKSWTDSPKAYGQIYIDDAAAGCPLAYDKGLSDRTYVDWQLVEWYLVDRGVLKVITK